MRNSDPSWIDGFPDENYIATLKRAITGAASNEELAAAVGWCLAKYRDRGAGAVEGSTEWRTAARALAVAELEAEPVAWSVTKKISPASRFTRC